MYLTIQIDSRKTQLPSVFKIDQGIIKCKGMETFAKKPKLAKLLRELKPMPVRYNKESWLVFCRMSVLTCTRVLFPTIDIFILACIDSWKVYNWLISACTVKTAIGVHCLCAATSKRGTFFGLLRSSFFFIRVRRNEPGNLAFKTAIIEDTRLTLAAIPFKVEANNSLIFLLLQTYETFLYSL